MKQLLIVNSGKAINAGATYPTDLSGLQAGAISFFELGASAFLSAAPTKNFAIALGRANGQLPFIISEVDKASLSVTKALPTEGKTFDAKITIPSPTSGKTYTLILVKKGASFNERNSWTVTETLRTDETLTAAQLAAKLAKGFQDKVDAGSINVTVTIDSAAITIKGNSDLEDWELNVGDALYGTPIYNSGADTDQIHAVPAVGDKKFIEKIAQECAAGKGFNYLAEDGKELYPNYPEAVENLIPNHSEPVTGASTEGYALYTLRFQVGRDASKTRDEKVWQLVHIAVPITADSYSTIQTILGQ